MKGYIYIIQAKQTELYKIGISKNVNSRLRQLQTYSPHSLEVVYSAMCAHPKKLESAIHEYLDTFRQKGEWFSLPSVTLHEMKEFLTFNLKLKNIAK